MRATLDPYRAKAAIETSTVRPRTASSAERLARRAELNKKWVAEAEAARDAKRTRGERAAGRRAAAMERFVAEANHFIDASDKQRLREEAQSCRAWSRHWALPAECSIEADYDATSASPLHSEGGEIDRGAMMRAFAWIEKRREADIRRRELDARWRQAWSERVERTHAVGDGRWP